MWQSCAWQSTKNASHSVRILKGTPVGAAIKYQAREKPGLDWWGVNYYARGAITGWCLPAHAPGELMTDMKARPDLIGARVCCATNANVDMKTLPAFKGSQQLAPRALGCIVPWCACVRAVAACLVRVMHDALAQSQTHAARARAHDGGPCTWLATASVACTASLRQRSTQYIVA